MKYVFSCKINTFGNEITFLTQILVAAMCNLVLLPYAVWSCCCLRRCSLGSCLDCAMGCALDAAFRRVNCLLFFFFAALVVGYCLRSAWTTAAAALVCDC